MNYSKYYLPFLLLLSIQGYAGQTKQCPELINDHKYAFKNEMQRVIGPSFGNGYCSPVSVSIKPTSASHQDLPSLEDFLSEFMTTFKTKLQELVASEEEYRTLNADLINSYNKELCGLEQEAPYPKDYKRFQDLEFHSRLEFLKRNEVHPFISLDEEISLSHSSLTNVTGYLSRFTIHDIFMRRTPRVGKKLTDYIDEIVKGSLEDTEKQFQIEGKLEIQIVITRILGRKDPACQR